MADYLAGLQSFTVRTSVADEVSEIRAEGRVMSNGDLFVQRPNRLRSTQTGNLAASGSGTTAKDITVACPASGSFQTTAAPPTLDPRHRAVAQ